MRVSSPSRVLIVADQTADSPELPGLIAGVQTDAVLAGAPAVVIADKGYEK